MIPIRLTRPDSSYPWGFRLEGGVDLGQALTIQRVKPNSLAHTAGLVSGDIVLQINSSDARNMRHENAKMEIIRSCNDISFLVQRYQGGSGFSGFSSQAPSFHTPPPNIYQPPASDGMSYQSVKASTVMQSPPIHHSSYSPDSSQRNVQQTVIQRTSQSVSSGSSRWPSQNNSYSPVANNNNSYTTGSSRWGNNPNAQKQNNSSFVSKPTPTWSIGTRHNAIPQPFLGADGVTHQVAHKQFNSPMGLYSNTNVQDSLQSHIPQSPQTNSRFSGGSVSPQGGGSSTTGYHQDGMIELGEEPHCCGVCSDLIIGTVFLKVQNRIPIHPHCLVCSRCGISLKNKGYFFIKNRLFCENHAA